jgi:hypothetical protein
MVYKPYTPTQKESVMEVIHTHHRAFVEGGDAREKAWEAVYQAWEAAEGHVPAWDDDDLHFEVARECSTDPFFVRWFWPEEDKEAAYSGLREAAFEAWWRLYDPDENDIDIDMI